ncbi:ATP-binding cassette domain-containing protein [Halorubrum terrestre]|uniref:ATP-binding cassette domain-containing protein n=1 Tax=Halorubrum distributum TaxID=29283 RepID=A0A6B1I9I9_9EURY|nr:ABC transporter ATP-binding protein [Halorubrum terrestre]MYL15303.1 ATP-binding cassette domain-containing protein [Halorubrum terrestre]
MTDASENITWRAKLTALRRVAQFRPKITAVIVVLGGATAFLEGIGLSFIWPILEVAQAEEPITQAEGLLGVFLRVYQFIGIPFRLEYLIVGVGLAMTVRFTFSFLVTWLRSILQTTYEELLRTEAFDSALDAKVSYFDEEGSDDILNAIITETRYSGKVIRFAVQSIETMFLALVYLSVMFYIAPRMALGALALLGGITYLLREVIEPAYTVGSRVATSNERVQEAVQAGTQGIRDVKLFGLAPELFENFDEWIGKYRESSINLGRNKAAIRNFYDLAAALTLFALIYAGFTYSGLALGALGIFFLAMFRLAPLVSRLNSNFYNMEGNLPHLIRTQEFVEELDGRRESEGEADPGRVSTIEFDDVRFSYNDDEQVLDEISFTIDRGEFVAFVGQSGAGKSTIVSLLARFYDPDAGEITADGTPINEFDLRAWRDRIAVVRQQPFIFNDTLEGNVTVGNRDASREAVEEVCAIAKVDEFADDLPNGYDSQLGDDGVRLSGGQRQRVALARALLTDADFLVLDEATSDLDSSLEKEVQASIEAMDRDYGMIAIAHRLSTVQNADRIYTIDNGEIVEAGTHEELLGAGGDYADLYTIQSEA